MIRLYHTSHCPNCHSQEKILQQLQNQQTGFDYTSINLETAEVTDIQPPIQAVPTLFIGPYRFEGLMPANRIRFWNSEGNHDADYVKELLTDGRLELCLDWLQQHPTALAAIVDLLADENLSMGVRVGLDAILEQLAEQGALSGMEKALGNLLSRVGDSMRIDVLHYLAMIGTPAAYALISQYTQDAHPEVQRTATELLDEAND